MLTQIFDLKTKYDEGMNAAAEVIRQGGLVGMPTETVYGLAADAMNESAVARIFSVKGRPQDNPLIVHIDDIAQINAIAHMTPLAEKLAKAYWPGPLTLVLKKKDGAIPDIVTCGMDTVAVRLPSSPHARQLIRRSGRYIAAPSANISGKPSPTKAAHVMDDFSGRIPVVLDGGECDVGLESTVCAAYGEKPVILRPGGITEQMIARIASSVEISSAVLEGLKEDEQASSPGMKYMHYSPNAEVTIADGENRQDIAAAVIRQYDKSEGKTMILCLSDTADLYGGRRHRIIGDTPEDYAHVLFDELRRSDDEGEDNVILEAVKPEGIGLAVMNRALRAAGFKVVK